MKARILVAVVLAPLFFVDLFFLPPVCLAVTVSAIAAMASYELLRATKVVHHNHMYVYTALSAAAIAQAKQYLDSKGIACLEATGTKSDEIIDAAQSLVGAVDAVFTPTDNTVMAVEGRVAEILTEAGIPHYAGADSFVKSGAFATCGVNYTELGGATADMALGILQGGEVPAYRLMDGGIITVNTEAAQALGLSYGVYSSMANTVVEVTTQG